jgi:hypothetical protein
MIAATSWACTTSPRPPGVDQYRVDPRRTFGAARADHHRSAAGGADGWIVVPAPPGGPGWGHAVDLATSRSGVDEAVHRDFAIDSAKAATMTLGHVGQIGRSPPSVDYSILLTSI